MHVFNNVNQWKMWVQIIADGIMVKKIEYNQECKIS